MVTSDMLSRPQCWNAATSVVRGMADLGPSFLRNTAECHNVFGAFASGFLFKVRFFIFLPFFLESASGL